MKFIMLENNMLINPEDISSVKENSHYENTGSTAGPSLTVSGCTITFRNGKEIHTRMSLFDLTHRIEAAKL